MFRPVSCSWRAVSTHAHAPTSARRPCSFLLIHIYKTIQRITQDLEGILAASHPCIYMLRQVGMNMLENKILILFMCYILYYVFMLDLPSWSCSSDQTLFNSPQHYMKSLYNQLELLVRYSWEKVEKGINIGFYIYIYMVEHFSFKGWRHLKVVSSCSSTGAPTGRRLL